jgi:hypothetical protein
MGLAGKQVSQRLQRLANAVTVELQGGHPCYFDSPDTFVEYVWNYVRQIASSRTNTGVSRLFPLRNSAFLNQASILPLLAWIGDRGEPTAFHYFDQVILYLDPCSTLIV